MTGTLTLKTPSDVAAAVPQIMGFNPEDSVVLLTFGPSPFHARVDLPYDAEGRAALIDNLRDPFANNRTERALLVTYTEDVERSEAMIDDLVEFLGSINVEVMDAFRVSAGHIFAHSGEQVGIVDPTNRILGTIDPSPKMTRAELEAWVAPPSEVDPDVNEALQGAAKAATVTSEQEHALFVQHVNSRIEDGLEVTLRERALLLVVLANDRVRDAATAWGSREHAQRYAEFWTSMVQRFPASVPAYQCLAFAAWQAGNGALAWCALDQIVELDKTNRMAHLLATVLTNGVNPDTWEFPSYADLPVFKDN